MTKTRRPGAHHSNRAGEFVLGRTTLHTTEMTDLQRYRGTCCRIVRWRVSRWLGVEAVEVKHD